MSKLGSFLLYFIPFTLILFIAQYFLTEQLSSDYTFFYHTWSIYTFHSISTLLIYIFLLFVNKNFADKTGFAFLSCGLLKMMAVVVFLIPLIKADVKESAADIAAFFIPYFLFLLFETLFAVRLINKL